MPEKRKYGNSSDIFPNMSVLCLFVDIHGVLKDLSYTVACPVRFHHDATLFFQARFFKNIIWEGCPFALPWVVPPKLSQEHCNVHLRGLAHIINLYQVVIVNISLMLNVDIYF